MIYQEAETSVLRGTAPSRLRFANIDASRFRLIAYDGARARCLSPQTDYELDPVGGFLMRRPGSTIGDYRDSAFFGRDPFDHTRVERFGNDDYLVYASYVAEGDASPHRDIARARAIALDAPAMPRLRRKIASGQRIRYAVFGDSISTGADAMPDDATYFQRLARLLNRMGCETDVHMCAIGGETSADGLARIERDVLPLHADLVSIAYGMNDQNRHRDRAGEVDANSVPCDRYARNIATMARMLLDDGSDVVLVSACEPNPRWIYASDDAPRYAEALAGVARELGIPMADAHHIWRAELDAGKTPEDLLHNDINHPTGYGHGLYFCALASVL